MAHEGWAVLEALWLLQISEIEQARDKCASKATTKAESDWRYMAGQEKGFKLAMMKAKMALAEMELANENETAESRYDKLLEEIKGTK